MPEIKFIWERIKQRKLGYLVIVIALALIWLPTLTPDDWVFIPLIIGFLGLKVYLTIAFILIGVILFNFSKVKPLMSKPNGSEAERVCKKLHDNENEINACIKKNGVKSD